jgi:selenocysteine lyase/cysteine desulfurase
MEDFTSMMKNIDISKILKKNNLYSSKEYLNKMYQNIIGNNYIMKSPFDFDNFLIYCDYTASGRGLNSLEDFITDKVLPKYANLHSTVGFCSEQTSSLSRESKDILRDYCNAWGNFSIIYHGQGCTGAIYKCIDLLNIKHYVKFYETLESLAKIHNTLFKENNYKEYEIKKKIRYEIMTRDLRRKIDKYYRLFFFKCNFCHKFKTFDKIIYRCLLCKDKDGKNLCFGSEGEYYSHEKTDFHISNRKEFYKNPNKNLFNIENDSKEYSNFLDEIRRNYKITEEKVNWGRVEEHYEEEESKLYYIYDLIKDYKRFKPVVFVSIYEHNSNKLSWIETQAEVITVNNLEELHKKLISEEYKNRYIKIGSFTAASNITGLLIDVDAFSIEMHKNGGFAFFDYASAAPYLQINVNSILPDEYRKKLKFENKFSKEDIEKYCYKDGIFYSPHKFIGGPNTPGILIIHNRITMNSLKPTQAGGGTVNYVFEGKIEYSLDIEVKEESGTPNIIGGIRNGVMTYIRSKIEHDLLLILMKNIIN